MLRGIGDTRTLVMIVRWCKNDNLMGRSIGMVVLVLNDSRDCGKVAVRGNGDMYFEGGSIIERQCRQCDGELVR